MTKLQTNFSFQSFQPDNEDSKRQFIYQLQTLFTNVSNATNATIDDMSYWSRERATGETWIDGTQIYTKTVTGTITGNTTSVAHGLTNIQRFVEIVGTLTTGEPISGTANATVPIPLGSTSDPLNIYVQADATNVTVQLTGATWLGLTFYVTLKYTKVKNA